MSVAIFASGMSGYIHIDEDHCNAAHQSLRAMVQWLNLPAWKVGDHGFEPHSGLQVSKKQNVSSPLTRKYLLLWGTSVTER